MTTLKHILTEMWRMLVGRLHGPMTFRLIMQPWQLVSLLFMPG
jgi:hypothetical protein